MPISMGIPGFDVPQHERVSMLVASVGGPVKAAALTGRSRGHIDNMRKPDAALRLDDLLPLCEAAGVSLDWVATGYQVRPDLDAAGLSDSGLSPGPGFGGDLPGFVRLLPVRPRVARAAGAEVERWEPSEVAVSAQWLDANAHLTSDTARYAIAVDDGMAPLVRAGAFLVVDTRPAKPRSGVYLIEAGDELVARRLSLMPGGRLELTADGIPNWRLSLDAGEMTVLHRVVWAGQNL